MNNSNVTSHEILDPIKRPNDANELLLFSDTSISNETHSNEISQIRMVTGSIFLFRYFVIPNSLIIPAFIPNMSLVVRKPVFGVSD